MTSLKVIMKVLMEVSICEIINKMWMNMKNELWMNFIWCSGFIIIIVVRRLKDLFCD